MCTEVHPVNEPYKAIVSALWYRDQKTLNHCQRVVGLAEELGYACGLEEVEMGVLLSSARLHDVGKIGIPDIILFKPGSLNESEYEIMKTHSVTGEDIVRAMNMKNRDQIALAVRHHHEYFSGNGYPDGLSGEDIPIHSRIISITDSYDAMIEMRLYHATLKHDVVMQILLGEKGHKSDPYVADHFEHMIKNSPYRAD